MIKKIDYIVLYLLLFIVLVLLVYLSFNEFWQDELYSIYHFQLVPLEKTITDYHSTNNHILYNFLCSIFLKAGGINEMAIILEKPYLLRILSGLFSISALLVLYKQSVRLFNKEVAYLIVFIMATSVLFIDFSMQARGYSLGILLTTVQTFTFYEFRKYGYSMVRKISQLCILAVLQMLLLPTNIYFLAGIGTILMVDLIRVNSYRAKETNRRNIFLASLVLLLVSIGSVIFYMWLQSLQPPNIFLDTYSLFNWKHLYQLFSIPYNFSHFRIILWLLIIGSLIVLHRRIYLISAYQQEILFFLFLFILPLIFFFIHGSIIVQRIFIPLLPVFAILSGLLFYNLFADSRLYIFRIWQIGTICCFLAGLYTTRKHTIEDNVNSVISMNLRDHYYLVKFNPLEALKTAIDLQKVYGFPIFVKDDFGERGIYFYFDAYQVNYQKSFPDTPSKAIYVTNNKKETDNWMAQYQFNCKKLIPDNFAYTVYAPEE